MSDTANSATVDNLCHIAKVAQLMVDARPIVLTALNTSERQMARAFFVHRKRIDNILTSQTPDHQDGYTTL